ncbi:MAG: HRDC domain-containing protein [Actinomycetota bacterium]
MTPGPAEIITDADGVAQLARAIRGAGVFALDLEFMWERTYAPQACLAQVAVDGEVVLVDPLQGAPLDVLGDLVADPDVTTVVHAPSADFTLLAMRFGTRPSAVRDVQLTAGFVGLGAGQSLGALLDRVLRVRLDKSEGYTDWTRRPLRASQLSYAVEDVRHLVALDAELRRRLEERSRGAWAQDEHDRRYGPGTTWVPDPQEAWRRVKGQGKLNARDRAVLREVAAWREREARRRDRPVAWLLPDRALVELARRRPADRDGVLAERGVPDRLRPSDVDGLLACIRAGEDAPPVPLPPAPHPDVQLRMEVLGPLGQVLVAARAQGAGIAPSLVATRAEIEGYMVAVIDGGADGLALSQGWRHELAGDALARLARGELALAPSLSRPFVTELPLT